MKMMKKTYLVLAIAGLTCQIICAPQSASDDTRIPAATAQLEQLTLSTNSSDSLPPSELKPTAFSISNLPSTTSSTGQNSANYQAQQIVDYAPDSIEARVSEATTLFGLQFLNNLSANTSSNVVFSPLSVQNLLNMVLLGTQDGSATQSELIKVLNYVSTNLFTTNNTLKERLKPHQAMHNIVQNILDVTSRSTQQHTPVRDLELHNTNSASLLSTPIEGSQQKSKSVAAHLQTSSARSDLNGQVNFTLVNLILTDKDKVDLNVDYEKELNEYYNVNVQQFTSDSNKNKTNQEPPIHERINGWVKNNTANQIEKLVNEEDFDQVVMILLNAAHFKGQWLHTFDAKATVEKQFFNDGKDDDTSQVQFMRQKDLFGYADFSDVTLRSEMGSLPEDAETLLTYDRSSEVSNSAGNSTNNSASAINNNKAAIAVNSMPVIELSREETRRMELTAKLNCTVLELPFSLNEGQEMSMVFLLPSKRDGLAKLQAVLDAATLNEIYKSLSVQQVQVELPKFSFEASHDAKDILTRMGLSTIFGNEANLERMVKSKMGDAANVQVNKVIHKAKITVDELGAEAAAASAANVVLRNFIRPPTPIFIADHPFLFVIRHNRSNMPLFIGRVGNFY